MIPAGAVLQSLKRLLRGDAIDLPRRLLTARALALFLAHACWPDDARAEGRFGAPGWVAPDSLHEAVAITDGPRVAPRDHERGWETALRAPFRLATLPLRLVASGLELGVSHVGPRYLDPKPRQAPESGFSLAPNITFGAPKDMGFGPALAWSAGPEQDVRVTLSGTWSVSDRRRVRLLGALGERRPVGLQLRAAYEYEPNRRYFGIGNDTRESQLSYFLLAGTTAEGTLRLGLSPVRQLRINGGYARMRPGRSATAAPRLEEVFAPGNTPFQRQASHTLGLGVSGDLAALDRVRDPSSGLHGRVDLRRALGVSRNDPDYDRWRLEGRAYLPVFAQRRVIAMRVVYTGVDPRGTTASAIPFYQLAQSEGAEQFAGFRSERFRDRQLLLGRIEYRWEMLFRLSAIALYELGEVASHTGEFRLRSAHRSYGGGLRVGLSETRTLRCELAKSVEGLRLIAALRGDF